tara:strand:+ start:2998 stop:3681 length:684 start_codon:yes stop_codon:yes gene_type:complete
LKYTNYSSFFGSVDVFACTSHNDLDYSINKNKKSFIKSLNLNHSDIAVPIQTHSNNLRVVNEDSTYSNTDGLINYGSNKILTLLTADCIPLFIYDKIKKNISLIHSGWRGLYTGIFFNAVDILFKVNNNIKDFKFVIGPSIKKCCYEVDIKVYSKFDKKFYTLKNDGKAMLDLQSILLNQILSYGFFIRNVLIDPECTKCSYKKFFSYRREKEKSGRMLSIFNLMSK